MQAQKKVLQGYMRYCEETEDPNFLEAVKIYGSVNAVYAAIEAWKEESEDPSDIPVNDIILMLSKERYKLISHP